ncbi:thymidylate synthase [uncultured Jatrophihabitans sp.]|uniref:thymidylate synthase n=1 Tax=uncultured Jatrophihabitans sp. TaxID=1610747 RepID=UPI0035CA6298
MTTTEPDTKPASPAWIARPTIGTAWLAVAGHILDHGTPGSWDGVPLTEVLRATLDVDAPAVTDPIIDRYADPERLAWMHANFTDASRVAELDHADSYATRLYDYARSGRNQIDWVIDHIRNDPATRNATITTLQPLTDTTYIPCVSLLDFWLAEDALHLGVYAHGIDFGTKGYANLVELAALQHHVADALGKAVGSLAFTVKSAHIYDTERSRMGAICAAVARPA